MRKVFLLMTTALFSFEAWAQTEECVEAPSCTDLGYTRTEEECPTGSVKCPWNTGLVYCECGEDYKYTCDGTNEKAGDSQCNGLYAACACADGYKWENGSCAAETKPEACTIGSIYYADGTCHSIANHDTGKTVLGIVVYVNPDGIGGQIMAPWFVDENGNKNISGVGMIWGAYTDIRELPNLSSSQAEADFDSCGNTDKIVAVRDVSDYQAAWATRKYAPTAETKGKWCLPAAGVLRNIQKNWSTISAAVSKAGSVSNLVSYWVWSSSECSHFNAWSADLDANGLKEDGKGGYSNGYVVPVMEF